MKSSRILVSAYGCEPDKGSEQGVGWNWCIQLARFVDVVVLTRSNNRESIKAAIPSELACHISFEYYDLPLIFRCFKRKEKGLYLYYLLWQWGAYKYAQRMVSQCRFDYCMHITFGSIWMPTFMHLLPLPFIWGPIGGGEAIPFRLISTLPIKGRLVQYLRYVLMLTVPFNPLIMNIANRAKFILARTSDTARLFPGRYASKIRVILETAMADHLLEQSSGIREDGKGGKLKVVYTGRLIASKNVAMAIYAVAQTIARGTPIQLTIVGDGPLRAELHQLADALQVSENMVFCGAVSHSEVLDILYNNDVYLFPSLKEGGVWSLMEAMSLGLPVICVNTSGMGVITDDSSAIRIELDSQEKMIESFSEALSMLAQTPGYRRRLGENARKRVREKFLWRHKGEFMSALFAEFESASENNFSI